MYIRIEAYQRATMPCVTLTVAGVLIVNQWSVGRVMGALPIIDLNG